MVVFGPFNGLLFTENTHKECYINESGISCLSSTAIAQKKGTSKTPDTDTKSRGLFGLDQAAGDLFDKPGKDIPSIISNVVLTLLNMVGVIFLILIIYGGIQWMTSGGNEQRIEKAKKILLNATVGLIIIILAYAITYFVVEGIVNAQQLGDHGNL